MHTNIGTGHDNMLLKCDTGDQTILFIAFKKPNVIETLVINKLWKPSVWSFVWYFCSIWVLGNYSVIVTESTNDTLA